MRRAAKTSMPVIGKRAEKGFLSDWWEAFVISGRYGMGDPLARFSMMWTESHSQLPVKPHLALKNLIALSEDREQWRGEACPPLVGVPAWPSLRGEAGGHHPSVTP